MKFNSKLLNEAIADANELKELAVQNAMGRLKEHFEPAVKRIISTKLSEIDDLEDEEEAPIDVPAPEEAAPEAEPEFNFDAEEGAPEAEMAPEDEFSEEDEDELGLDEIIAELEGELAEEEGMEDEEEITEDEDDPYTIEEDEDMEAAEDEDEDVDTEDIAEMRKKIRESIKRRASKRSSLKENTKTKTKTPASSNLVNENKRLKSKLAEANAELVRASKVVRTQKSALNEINLLNTKLIYLTKLTSAIQLTGNQQIKVLESFDRAKNPREVKLLYTALCESMKRTTTKSKTTRTLKENASAPIRTLGTNKPADTGFAMKQRWQKLAGIN